MIYYIEERILRVKINQREPRKPEVLVNGNLHKLILPAKNKLPDTYYTEPATITALEMHVAGNAE